MNIEKIELAHDLAQTYRRATKHLDELNSYLNHIKGIENESFSLMIQAVKTDFHTETEIDREEFFLHLEKCIDMAKNKIDLIKQEIEAL